MKLSLQCVIVKSLIPLRVNTHLETDKKEAIKLQRVMETEHKQEIQVIPRHV